MNTHLNQLEPEPLWRHFRTFCDTPRPSRHEEAILTKIETWAGQRGFAHERDPAGNLCIRKPASPGCEKAPGIVLQGHVDMVSETDAGVEHDFTTDPIETCIEDGWLKAQGTTLGADNGIGASAALAILDDDTLEHGPLEVLLTISEEISLIGASHLAANWLHGQLLLNLDSEEAGEVTIGCAGGASAGTESRLELQSLKRGFAVFSIRVHGLRGGHSGIDIHTGRANANRLLARILYTLLPHGLRLIDYDGGRMDNAITREARATVALSGTASDTIACELAELQATFRKELAGVDESVTIDHEPSEAKKALTGEDTQRLVRLLHAAPFGVERMSLAAPGVVETSNNLGIVRLRDGVFTARLMTRSLLNSARDALVERIAALFEVAGFPAHRSKGYPGWTPDPDSALLQRFIAIHESVTGHKPKVEVLHAGLECGLIGAKYPHMDMISFGPTIRGAHAPAECVDIQSVETFYRLLRTTITELAAA